MTSAGMAYAPMGAASLPGRPGRERFGPAEWFLMADVVCSLALIVPHASVGPLRILWRMGLFVTSMAMLVLLPGKVKANGANLAALWLIALLLLEMFHPTGNTWLAIVAEVILYIASIAPLFWMSKLKFSVHRFRRAVQIFWGYYSLSAAVGMLQVYFPGKFEPQLSPMIAALGDMAEGLKITLANGHTIWRPMGLTDMPGGASTAAMWAILFGLGFLLTTHSGRYQRLRRLIYFGSMMAGVVVIYLSQVRAALIIVAIWFAALLVVLFWRARWREFRVLLAMVLVLGVGGFVMAARLGGAATVQRVSSLGGSKAQLYGNERGSFLDYTFTTMIPEYPLGAGLGRWGMMNGYFGNNADPNTAGVYVEIQWQGWVLDGGVPMLISYVGLLLATLFCLSRIARRRGPLAMWAILCMAFDVGIFAFCFSYTPFTGQMGIEFWFINALVLAAANGATAAAAPVGWMAAWPYALPGGPGGVA